jgi:hypothetical protein
MGTKVLSPTEAKYLKATEEIDGMDFWMSEDNALYFMGLNSAVLVNPDCHQKWQTLVDEEHNQMIKFGVQEAVRRGDLRTASKIITSTWGIKKKASGT